MAGYPHKTFQKDGRMILTDIVLISAGIFFMVILSFFGLGFLLSRFGKSEVSRKN
jgi:hypothetical protein